MNNPVLVEKAKVPQDYLSPNSTATMAPIESEGRVDICKPRLPLNTTKQEQNEKGACYFEVRL